MTPEILTVLVLVAIVAWGFIRHAKKKRAAAEAARIEGWRPPVKPTPVSKPPRHEQ